MQCPVIDPRPASRVFPPWLIKHRKRLFFKLKFAEMGIYWSMKTNSPNLRIFSKSIWHLKIKISCFCLHLRHKRWIPGYLAIWGVGGEGVFIYIILKPNPQTAQESSEHSRPLWRRQLSGIPRNPGILPHLPFPAPLPPSPLPTYYSFSPTPSSSTTS